MDRAPAQVKSLEMTLTPARPTYRTGELPEFTVSLTNRSQEPLKFCRYRLDYRLKAAMVVDGGQGGPDFEAQPFVSQTWEPLTEADYVTLAPGETLSHKLTFDKDPIFGFLRRAKQPPVIPSTNIIEGFPSGRFTFNTALSNQVGLYVGKNGVFDRKLEGRKVPDQWPGVSGYYGDLVEADATVVFE